jgi:WD40 repeat protein
VPQAHDTAVRAMTWSHGGGSMITADNGGIIKYWEPSMTNAQAFTAHSGHPIRGLSFGPRDTKFVSCSDDSTLKVGAFAPLAVVLRERACALERRCVILSCSSCLRTLWFRYTLLSRALLD